MALATLRLPASLHFGVLVPRCLFYTVLQPNPWRHSADSFVFRVSILDSRLDSRKSEVVCLLRLGIYLFIFWNFVCFARKLCEGDVWRKRTFTTRVRILVKYVSPLT